MSRYRKIEVCTWSDEKFRAFSRIPPCAQGLWLFLLTGPFTGPIPGLFRAGRAAISEELDWDPEEFDRAFQEIADQGIIKADFKSRLVWLPNAFRHNPPSNPNVVKSWRTELAVLPECLLKEEATLALQKFLGKLGGNFLEAFLGKVNSDTPLETNNGSMNDSANHSENGSENGLLNHSMNGSYTRVRNGLGNGLANQEQEQELQKDKSNPKPPKPSAPSFLLPDWIPREAWLGFEEMRGKIRKPMTDRARGMIVRKLEGFKESGEDPAAILDQSTMKSWQDVFPISSRGTQPLPIPMRKEGSSDYARSRDAQFEEQRQTRAANGAGGIH